MTALVVGAVVLGLLGCAAAVLALCARAPLDRDPVDLSRLDVLDGVGRHDPKVSGGFGGVGSAQDGPPTAGRSPGSERAA